MIILCRGLMFCIPGTLTILGQMIKKCLRKKNLYKMFVLTDVTND